jgi:tRNA(Ile)-lysidine synthase
LLLGHHADDQVESILLRIMKARLRSGAAGMKPIEWIPECHGIHGVYHSGGPTSETSTIFSSFEHGGIQVVRPLLRFEKSRLVATCEAHGTCWAEDKTNQDRTLTPRNAIRHIIRNHKLPQALSRNSILAVGRRLRSRVDKHEATAEVLFNSCPLKLDIQTASLVVRLPPVEAFFTDPTQRSCKPATRPNTYSCAFYNLLLLWRDQR